MVSTPAKSANTSINLTPVKFLNSPKASNEATSSSNHSLCKNRLDLITKTLQDNYSKWQIAQKRGNSLCTSIEAIKTRSLEASNKTPDDLKSTLYPQELKPYCDKLSIITSIFVDITANARESLRQLRALSKMSGMMEEIFYRTWKLQQFIDFTEHLVNCYERELVIKELVMRELPHFLNRSDLIRCSTAWEYPQYVGEEIAMYFALFKEELNAENR